MSIWKWCVVAIAATCLTLGVGTAAVVTGAIAKTGGNTAGLLVGGIPMFAGAFRDGVSAGNGNAKSNPGTSWNGFGDAGTSGVYLAPGRVSSPAPAPARKFHVHPKHKTGSAPA